MEKKKIIGVRVTEAQAEMLDRLAEAEGRMVTPSEMIRRLIERAANPAKLKGEPLPAADEKALRAVRRGVESALARKRK